MLCIVKNSPPMKSRTYASLEFWAEDRRNSAATPRVLIFLISLGAGVIRAMCQRRADLVLENLVLRQQVTRLKKARPRPLLEDLDRAFWVAPRRSWPVWASRLVIVHADTVARWNRDRFRRYWAKISRRRQAGRPRVDAEIRRLNPDDGSNWLRRAAHPPCVRIVVACPDAARQVMIPCILGSVYIQEEGPVGAVENPEGFPDGSSGNDGTWSSTSRLKGYRLGGKDSTNFARSGWGRTRVVRSATKNTTAPAT